MHTYSDTDILCKSNHPTNGELIGFKEDGSKSYNSNIR